MKNKMLIVVGGLLAALLVVGVVGATSAFAQEPKPHVAGEGHGPRGGNGPLGGAGLEAAAKALGMTTDEVTNALKDGKTLQDLADAAGVDIESVRDAIKAAHETELRERIGQAVAAGTMTQEKADWLLEGLEKGFLDGPGFGFGGPKGHGFGSGPTEQPTAQKSP